MSSSSPREQRYEETYRAILDAALAIITEKGLDKLTMRKLAERVKYSPAGLYEYFSGGKDMIIGLLAQEADSRLRAYLQAVPEDLAYKEYLVELGLAYVKFARENSQHFSLLFEKLSTVRMSHNEPIEEGSYQVLVDGVVRGLREGHLKAKANYDAQQMAYGLWAMVHGMATLQLTHLRGFQDDFAVTDRYTLDSLVSGMLAHKG